MSAPENDPPKTAGQKLESTAFMFCKIATVTLILGRFALPVAALLAAGLFIAAYSKGERETRCFLGPPLVVAGFWIAVVAVWVFFNFTPAGAALKAGIFPTT